MPSGLLAQVRFPEGSRILISILGLRVRSVLCCLWQWLWHFTNQDSEKPALVYLYSVLVHSLCTLLGIWPMGIRIVNPGGVLHRGRVNTRRRRKERNNLKAYKFAINRWFILNARPHTAAAKKRLLKRFRWEVFNHPPSSAWTWLPVIFISFLVWNCRRRTTFWHNELQTSVENWLKAQAVGFYDDGIRKLVPC